MNASQQLKFVPAPAKLVAMTQHKGDLFVATEENLYVLKPDGLRPIVMHDAGGPQPIQTACHFSSNNPFDLGPKRECNNCLHWKSDNFPSGFGRCGNSKTLASINPSTLSGFITQGNFGCNKCEVDV